MQRNCDVCGVTYEAKRKTSRYCADRCRTRATRARADGRVVALQPSEPAEDAGESGLVSAITRELSTAERLDTTLGQQALALARRIAGGNDTGSSVAALSKELRAVMDEALADVAQAADPIDELKRIRDRKRQEAAG